MRVTDYTKVTSPSLILIICYLLNPAAGVELKACSPSLKVLPHKCLTSGVPVNSINGTEIGFKFLVRPNVAAHCKTRRRTAWTCRESGKGELAKLEFFEDFPDWNGEYWKWRAEDLGEVHLMVGFRSDKQELRIMGGNGSSLKSPDSERYSDFMNIYVEKVTNDSCYQLDANKMKLYGNETVNFDCTYWGTTPKKPIQDIYIFLLFVASAFLLMTVIVYTIIWDRHTLHGWTVFSEVLSNFLMIVTVGLAHYFVRNVDNGPPSYGCVALALISHFFFLSTFFWMTAINFNLWRTFRNPKTPQGHNGFGRRRSIMAYVYYALFAMGVPFLLVLGSALLDFLHMNSPDSSGYYSGHSSHNDAYKSKPIRPEYGKKFCYIAKDAQGHFIYYPIGTLIVINSIFFGLTVLSLLKHRKETKVLSTRHRSSSPNRDKKESQESLGSHKHSSRNCRSESPTQSITLFAKLFCIMGVSWVFEIFAWAFSPRHENVPTYWIIYDVTNLVQAVAVFVIFVCKKDVLQHLQEQFAKMLMVIQNGISNCRRK